MGRHSTSILAAGVGTALLLGPLPWVPGAPLGPFLVIAALSLAAALFARSHALITLAGSLVVIEYGAAVLLARTDALVLAVVGGVGLLLLLELLTLAAAEVPGRLETPVRRGRAAYLAGVLAGGLAAAVVAALASSLVAAGGPAAGILAIGGAVAALVLIGRLAQRALQ